MTKRCAVNNYAIVFILGIAITNTRDAYSFENYGDFLGQAVLFQNVNESSPTDPTPLLHTPAVSGSSFTDILDFAPAGFNASASAGSSDITNSLLNFSINSLPGGGFTSINYSSSGDWTLINPQASTLLQVGAAGTLQILEVDYVPVAPLSHPFSLQPVVNNSTQGGFDLWSLTDTIDLAPVLSQNGITGKVTRLDASINTQAVALTDPTSIAFVSVKDLKITVTGSSSHVVIPPSTPPDPPTYGALSPPTNSVRPSNAIIMVHGWTDSKTLYSTSDPKGDQVWSTTDMKSDMVTRLGPNAANFDVMTYDWSDDAKERDTCCFGKGPGDETRRKAESNGRDLAKEILADGYTGNIHLIAHSLGGRVIETAKNELLKNDNWSGTIHQTFLDPYTPDDWDKTFGTAMVDGVDYSERVFAEQYYYDNLDFGQGNTENSLPNTLDVEITDIIDEYDDSGFETVFVQGHKWPVRWYASTVRETKIVNEGLGYPLSFERDSSPWPQTGFVGKSFSLPFSKKESKRFNTIRAQEYENVEGELLDRIPGGQFAFDADTAFMRTASPVWFTLALDLELEHDFVEFDYQFVEGVDGVLTVYNGESLIGYFDQLIASDSEHWSGQLFLPQLEGLGSLTLSFRLDTLGELDSAIEISAIRTGVFVAVPEPQAMLLMVCAIAFLFASQSPSQRLRDEIHKQRGDTDER